MSSEPGGSAKREYEKRRCIREQGIRDKHPRTAGIRLALQGEPQHQRAWQVGGEAEARVGSVLEQRCGNQVELLHDRRLPASKANIDHLAATPSGVWVIDTKRYRGKIAVTKPLFRGSAKLTIAGRDRTKLIDGLARQVAIVENVVGSRMPVHGVLCFVDGELPLVGTITIRGFELLYPRRLVKRLKRDGQFSQQTIAAVAAQLAAHFEPA